MPREQTAFKKQFFTAREEERKKERRGEEGGDEGKGYKTRKMKRGEKARG